MINKAGPAEKAEAKNLGARIAVSQNGLPAKPDNKKAVTVWMETAQGIERMITGLIHRGGVICFCSELSETRVMITFNTRYPLNATTSQNIKEWNVGYKKILATLEG